MQKTHKNTLKKAKPPQPQLLIRPHEGIGSAQGPHVFAANVPALPQQPHGVPIDNVIQDH